MRIKKESDYERQRDIVGKREKERMREYERKRQNVCLQEA